jgi:hypothetical protein
LLRAAVGQWLKNAPEELPLDLKVQIARENISHINETIKNLRWTYHQARNANYRIREMQKQEWLPPHTAQTITNLEETIIKLQTELDTWLRKEYTKKSQQP